jgi:hypothetical protein
MHAPNGNTKDPILDKGWIFEQYNLYQIVNDVDLQLQRFKQLQFRKVKILHC